MAGLPQTIQLVLNTGSCTFSAGDQLSIGISDGLTLASERYANGKLTLPAGREQQDICVDLTAFSLLTTTGEDDAIFHQVEPFFARTTFLGSYRTTVRFE